MRSTIVLVGSALLLGSGITAHAQEKKIGFVDSGKIRDAYKEFQKAQNELDSVIAGYQKKEEELRKEIEDLQDELERQRLVLSETKRKEKEQELTQKQKVYQDWYTSTFVGPQSLLEQERQKRSRPILDKILTTCKKVGQANGYTFVFDSAAGSLLYGDAAFDLTDKVLEDLNKSAAPTPTPPKGQK